MLVFMLLFALITPPALADEVPLEVFFREYFGQWKPDADIDTIVTANEKEALFLEDTLLKRHKPRYNIRLKDSKTYERQEKKSLVGCAVCGDGKVTRAPMAPRLGKRGKSEPVEVTANASRKRRSCETTIAACWLAVTNRSSQRSAGRSR